MKAWRRMLLCAMALFVCMGTAGAEGLLCVTAENCAALLTAQGREIIAPGSYDDIFPVTEDRYALGMLTDGGMLYALCDAEGNLLTDARFEMLRASEGLILFRQEGLYGAMNADGNLIVAPGYTQLAAAGDGGFLAMTGDPYDEDADAVLRISEDRTVSETRIYTDEGLVPLSDGRMPYQDPSNERYGYLDGQGRVVIAPVFETADGFINGLARASVDGKLGIIGTDGAWRVGPEYDYLQFGEGVIVALAGRERAVVFNMDGQEIFRLEGSKLEAAAAGAYPVILEGDVLRAYTPEGDELCEAGGSAMISAGAAGQLIVMDGLWGTECVTLVNPDSTAVEGVWQQVLPLDGERYAFVCMNAAAYYSDELEEIRHSVDYDSLRYGMMDPSGRVILPAEYLEIRALGNQRYLTAAADGLRVVDADGNVIWKYLKEE